MTKEENQPKGLREVNLFLFAVGLACLFPLQSCLCLLSRSFSAPDCNVQCTRAKASGARGETVTSAAAAAQLNYDGALRSWAFGKELLLDSNMLCGGRCGFGEAQLLLP